ncbi:hypothetical protein OPV22_010911 [Ensete ventricosum]|uniref:Uncharacterized protein n=1 Tax=Ensete ventricosum TaxID=4639 RepID=A0AAV8RE47_ENSVE|nr:hypothetical protein OPV22_010911 [Ensete ventricosum]
MKRQCEVPLLYPNLTKVSRLPRLQIAIVDLCHRAATVLSIASRKKRKLTGQQVNFEKTDRDKIVQSRCCLRFQFMSVETGECEEVAVFCLPLKKTARQEMG